MQEMPTSQNGTKRLQDGNENDFSFYLFNENPID
jgi:hypothetical protein